MKYKYIGTEEQLIEHGFEIHTHKIYMSYATRSDGINYFNIFINLNEKSNYYKGIYFNDIDNTDDITPYIQDLIDANLVEVIKE